jgi:hypothetical protein
MLAEELATLLPELAHRLGEGRGARWRVAPLAARARDNAQNSLMPQREKRPSN